MVVTRAGTRTGRAVVAALARGEGALAGVPVRALGMAPADLVPEPGAAPVQSVEQDLTTPAVVDRLRGARALVHPLAPDDLAAELADHERRDRLVREVQTLVLAAAAARVPHVVLITSAMVYGAQEGADVPLLEDAPRAAQPSVGLVGDQVLAEEALERSAATHPGLRTTLVRPGTLVAGTDTIMTRHFAAPRLLRLKDTSRLWQLCHVEDLARAVVHVIADELGPVVTVASEDWLTQEEVERLSGMRTVELGSAVATGVAQRLHRIGSLPSPATDLAYISQPWVVPSTRLRTAGWRATYDTQTCLGLLLEDAEAHRLGAARRLDRKDGAVIGTASAAVAAGAPAAIMRRRRKRGNG